MQRPPDAITDIIPPREGELRIQLPNFEGPLDLLLHLCKKHELDILDLPISFVTERYLEYLKLMENLDLDVAAEYLLMAATLAHIKSKMLLPRTPVEQQDDGELGEVTDPRADLIRRLLEYQKYKNAAETLGSRAISGRDVFPRGSTAAEAEGPAPLADIGMFKLLDAFEAILKRTKDRSAFEVTSERISIQERMTQISDLLRVRGSCTFEELFEKDVSRYEVVITFLALLEMTKMRLTRIHQAEYGAAIHVQHALLDASAPTIPPERERSADGEPTAVEPVAAAAAAAVFEEAAALVDDEDGPELDAEALEAEANAEAQDEVTSIEAEAAELTAEAEAIDFEAEALESDAEALQHEVQAEALEVEAEARAFGAESDLLEARAQALEAEARAADGAPATPQAPETPAHAAHAPAHDDGSVLDGEEEDGDDEDDDDDDFDDDDDDDEEPNEGDESEP
jgi:segregation and condensation protein A